MRVHKILSIFQQTSKSTSDSQRIGRGSANDFALIEHKPR